jgi:D-alanyl-D-alanine carboxypeptidase
MRKLSVLLLGLFATPLLLAAAATPAVSDQEVVARTKALIEQVIKRPEAVALSVSVGRGDRVLLEEGAGIADLELDVPANAQTIFRIGSVTKQFTAAGIMKLVERGKLGLEDDVRKHVPAFDSGGRVVTIRQLLNHTSGVPSYTNQPRFMAEYAPRDLTHAQLLASIKDVPFDFEPGKGYNYSNSGYYLLGMVIEAVDGRTYARFMQEEFFTPLGLTRTRYGSEREIIKNRAQGYALDPAGVRLNDALISMNVPFAAGALSASAGDLVRWQIALVGGRAVSAESGARYGFGLNVGGAEGRRRISHTGAIQGFNSMLVYLPETGLHVAVVSNSEALPSAALGEQIIAAITGAVTPGPQRTTQHPDSEAALRRLLTEVAQGNPDYTRMGEQLATAVRAQLPGMQPMMQARGAILSVTFQSVDMGGSDAYVVRFADGSGLNVNISLDGAGKIVGASVRPVVQAIP